MIVHRLFFQHESFCKKHRKIISVWLAELTEKSRYPTSENSAVEAERESIKLKQSESII